MSKSISKPELPPAAELRRPDTAEFGARSNSLPFMPTAQAYGELQGAFDFFNEHLVGGALPNVMITYTRNPRVLGHFCAEAFRDSTSATAHEIAMNPMWFGARPIEETLSTLVHEMKHLQRHLDPAVNRKGGKGAGGYHDARWADLMEEIGLQPFALGDPAKRTGFSVSHRIVEGGPFDIVCQEFLDRGGMISWRHNVQFTAGGSGGDDGGRNGGVVAGKPKTSTRSRTRFSCEPCQQNAWAKPSVLLSCGICARAMLAR